MSTIRRRSIAVAWSWLLAPLCVALAIGATPAQAAARSAEATPAGAQDEARALALFHQSEASYRAGKFHEAVDLLRQAYALHPVPILLYNLGRALESDGDARGAADAYERYLAAAPDVDDRGAIEQRVQTLRRAVAEREAVARERAEADRARQAAAALQRRLAQTPKRRPAVAPWALFGVGGAALVAGGTLGGLALARHDDAVGAPRQLDAVSLQNQARNFALGANVTLAVGGALAGAGLIWGIVDLYRVRAAGRRR